MSATVTLKTLNKSYIFDTITNSITHKKLVFAPSQYLFHQEIFLLTKKKNLNY